MLDYLLCKLVQPPLYLIFMTHSPRGSHSLCYIVLLTWFTAGDAIPVGFSFIMDLESVFSGSEILPSRKL